MESLKVNRCSIKRLETKNDVQNLLCSWYDAVMPYFSDGKAFLKLAPSGVHYSDRASWVEGFSRLLWGIVPLTMGGGTHEITSVIRQGIINGTNPNHEEYWGDISECNQYFVEMAAISYAILFTKESFYDSLPKETQNNLCIWLDKINKSDIGNNNWNFFRVLVDLAFEKVGYSFDDTLYKKSLENIDKLYREDGWYIDGEEGTYDYYNPFAFHFYGMIYYKIKKNSDVERCQRYLDRFIKFGQQYKEWVTEDGVVVPYGRSLTYRFAQIAYFSIAAMMDIEVIPWAKCKKIVLGNIRFWNNQNIFNEDKTLSIGYAYPNLVMSEGYNASGSPYWGLKTFAILSLPESHPFWTSKESDDCDEEYVTEQRVPGFLIQRMEKGKHVVILSGKQNKIPNKGYFTTGFTEKYEKFAYSSKYGFSISRGACDLEKGAFDSMLAIRKPGEWLYQSRIEQELVFQNKEMIISRWHAYPSVKIYTALIPEDGYQVRIHKIISDSPLETAEGGFCIRREDEIKLNKCIQDDSKAIVKNSTSLSLIIDLLGDRKGKIIKTEPNTNIMFSKAYLPMLVGTIDKGENYLVSAIFAGDDREYCKDKLKIIEDIKGKYLEEKNYKILEDLK